MLGPKPSKALVELAYVLADLLGGETEAHAWLEALREDAAVALPDFVSEENRALLMDKLHESSMLSIDGVAGDRLDEVERVLALIPLVRSTEDSRRPASTSRLVCTVPPEVSLSGEARYIHRSLAVLVEDSLRATGDRILLAAPYWSPRGTERLRGPLRRAIDRGVPITLAGARRGDVEHHGAMLSFGRDLCAEGARVSAFSFRPPRERSLFHAKIVAGRRGYLGTGNLSMGGFEDNVEVGLPLDEPDVARVWWLFEQLVAGGLLQDEGRLG